MDDNSLGRAIAATNRAIRNIESPRSSGPYLVEWVTKAGAEPWELIVLDPERFARDDSEGFARYLASENAGVAHWRFAKLLPKRLRPVRTVPPHRSGNRQCDSYPYNSSRAIERKIQQV